MKKIILSVAIAICCVFSANAQVYVGGSLGFTSTSVKADNIIPPNIDIKGSSFKFLPEIGIQLNDKVALGANLGFSKGYSALNALNIADVNGLVSTVVSGASDVAAGEALFNLDLKTFSIAPYIRYTLYAADRFEFFLDGVVGINSINFSFDATELTGESDAVLEDQKVSATEVFVRPVIAYAISDNVKLTAKVGALGFQSLTVKDIAGSGEDITISRFGLDAGGNNLMIGAQFSF